MVAMASSTWESSPRASIGEFVIKDALLDQHIEGKYRGDFAITEIRPSYYTTGGRLVVEIHIEKLDGMTLDDVDSLSDWEAARLSGNEVVSLDEVPAIQQPRCRTGGTPEVAPETEASAPRCNRGRRAFQYGPSGFCEPGRHSEHRRRCRTVPGPVWPLGEIVKLDTTVWPQATTPTVRATGRAGL
ncbi:DUF3275 family protein [Pseudomonas aeruginosa]|nr:DUF3275 family protein [Pseudomonas aeruginosa]